jgi:O-antigen ligase
MVLRAKTPMECTSRANFATLSLAIFALLAGVIASGSVLLNDAYFWGQSRHYINPYLFGIAFILGLPRKDWGLIGFVFLLPLSAGLGNQLNAYIGTSFLVLPNAGLDLAAGFFLGAFTGSISHVKNLYSDRDRFSKIRLLTTQFNQLVPWPIALVILMITISTAIAISRNIYQSAAATSFKGLLFNLVHFRPIGWHDDYMPISDWIAYALAVAVVITVIGYLKDQDYKNRIIFRPIMAGLIVAALMGVAQALTGIGLPENLLSFRKDQLGYAVIGFQPDLHAFAGHMLLGAVGLWGYFYSGISKLERKFVLLAVSLSWVGLILSKSRALLLISLIVIFIWLVWYLWKNKRRFFLPAIVIALALISIFAALIFNYSSSLSGIPVLSWLGELANEFKSRDLTSWSLFSGIFGSRFEIWGAAIRMWWEFPLMGIGQGNFYRLSDIASFSKSHFLILNHGENAHNYFLQTLTETGLVGVAIFSLALITPFLSIKNRAVLIPASIALGSLFLGNIFSHSFLVRENLIIASILIALILSQSQFSATLSIAYSARLKVLVIFFIGAMSIYEINGAFSRAPFEYGRDCFVSNGLMRDKWKSGIFDIPVPPKAEVIRVFFEEEGYFQRQFERPIEWQFLGVKEVPQKNTKIFLRKSNNRISPVEIAIPSSLIENAEVLTLRLKVTSCFTPRNLGIGLDARRLGLQVERVEIL